MDFSLLLLLCIGASLAWQDNKIRKFKDGFLFGVGSSAYQVEGAWNEDGRGESIWDRLLHTFPQTTPDSTNGDVAADSYHKVTRDVQMVKELGVNFYRFSVSWSRVLPTGFSNKINEKGLQYYESLIDELLKYNIEPMLTLYHLDLPQPLQDLGGWANPLIVDWFEDYAGVVFDRFASKVKFWVTINQPNICSKMYSMEIMPPKLLSKGIGEYLCVKNILLAHARAYRLYEKKYKKKFKGSVGISIAAQWIEPVNNKTENVEAADEFTQFLFGMYIHPIWSTTGDFPQLVKDVVARNSKAEGFSRSRLPTLSSEEIRLLKGSSDFLGLNHYTTWQIRKPGPDDEVLDTYGDARVAVGFGEQWTASQSSFIKSVPYGLYKLCLHLNQNYDYPTIFFTENGWSTTKGLSDKSRIEYLKEYLYALLLAIEDGSDVKGYSHWSLMDNYEWLAGNSERFGLFEVDFDSKNKTRTARNSAYFYSNVIRTKLLINSGRLRTVFAIRAHRACAQGPLPQGWAQKAHMSSYTIFLFLCLSCTY